MKTKQCDDKTRAGRLKKAEGFLQAADITQTFDDDGEFVDACITLYVHSGIAAADVVCCARIGEHSSGKNHIEAVALLEKADKTLAPHLKRLLGLKTRSGYGAVVSSGADLKVARRVAEKLTAAARLV